jgi:hypothetical protein
MKTWATAPRIGQSDFLPKFEYYKLSEEKAKYKYIHWAVDPGFLRQTFVFNMLFCGTHQTININLLQHTNIINIVTVNFEPFLIITSVIRKLNFET